MFGGNTESTESEVKKTALKQIEKLKRKMQSKSLARLFCCMHSGDKNYVFSMDNLERILDRYLEQVDRLTEEYELGKEIYSKFKKQAAEILYDAAMKRNEYKWAGYFEKKYGH